ncbi:MAG: hypothetical protein JXX29_09090 [Deltaproteobacteria bacterium]|nr:hypothetical protein [Deltaproteobacteria bacterium]MBN2671817.1 hypothetical protein [Deltaproteobacteria bacterium]
MNNCNPNPRPSTSRSAMLILFVLLSHLSLSCDSGLDASYDAFRDQVPAVCKDFCEEKVACERAVGDGDSLDDDAFTSQVHFCEIECGAYASEGAYVWRDDASGYSDRIYTDHLDGAMVMDAFDCLYEMGAYRCVDNGTEYIHQFNPAARNVCDASNDCIDGFAVDHAYYWSASTDGLGGACYKSGSDFIDAIFF